MTEYRGTGATLDEAITAAAHDQLSVQPHTDLILSRVVAWGMQTGGFVFERRYWAVVSQDAPA